MLESHGISNEFREVNVESMQSVAELVSYQCRLTTTSLTEECSVAVLPPSCCNACPLSVGDEEVWSRETLKDTATRGCLSYEHRSIKVPLAHVVHVHGIKHGTSGWRTYLPYCPAECVTGVERDDGEALAFSWQRLRLS